jgi:hypothetical protein
VTELDYECHITIEPLNRDMDFIEGCVTSAKWRYSKIDGDPDLGIGTRCYATQLYHHKDTAIALTCMMAEYFQGLGFTVIRSKVEQVIFDTNNVTQK